jgi:multimeric flavodoxin WrbA
LGSPVYCADVTPEMKALLDRAAFVSYANGKGMLKHKVAGAVTAVRRGGGLHAFDTMNHFLHLTETFLVGASYWNMVYGLEPGDVERDEEGMKNMKVFGENMSWLLKRINN